MDAVFRPRTDIPFCETAFEKREQGRLTENPIPHDDAEDKEKSPTTITVSERATQPPALVTVLPIATEAEKFSDYKYRKLYQ